MGLLSAHPNRARPNLDQSQGHPTPLRHHRDLQEHLPGRPATGEGRPNSDKGFATKISNLPDPPYLPLHSQTHSPTQSSLHPKTLAEQPAQDSERSTRRLKWLPGTTNSHVLGCYHTLAVCSQPRASAVPGNSGKKGEAMVAPLEPKPPQGARHPSVSLHRPTGKKKKKRWTHTRLPPSLRWELRSCRLFRSGAQGGEEHVGILTASGRAA